jgi:hypothetical protein
VKTGCGASRLAILTVIFGLTQLAAQKAPAFAPRDYPSVEYKVTRASHTLDDVTIQIIQAKKQKPNRSAPSYCRAWVEVSRGKKLLQRIYYGDMEPVGYSYGVFVPAKQPSADYFALVKEGDYDGHLLLVDKQGVVTDLMGGSFFVTAGGRFIVSQYSSDSSGLAVFDLQAQRPLLQSKEIPYIQNWYKDGSGYFFTESEWSNGNPYPHEKPDVAYRLDWNGRKVVKSGMDPQRLKSATRVEDDFDPRKSPDCDSR